MGLLKGVSCYSFERGTYESKNKSNRRSVFYPPRGNSVSFDAQSDYCFRKCPLSGKCKSSPISFHPHYVCVWFDIGFSKCRVKEGKRGRYRFCRAEVCFVPNFIFDWLLSANLSNRFSYCFFIIGSCIVKIF